MPPPLSRVMPCSWCDHDEHVMRCEALIDGNTACPCRDVPVPGLYP